MHFVAHVLVIGGGDGGVLGELSWHLLVDQIYIFEIDEMVINESTSLICSLWMYFP